MNLSDESIRQAPSQSTAPQAAALQAAVKPQAAPDALSHAAEPLAEPVPQVPPADAAGPTAEPAHGPQGIQFVISVLVIVVFMITFVMQAFRVPSESMEKTLLIGDFLLADKLHFAKGGGIWHWLLPYRPIRRGDIIVFRYPVDPSQYFVKRVIGLPGDRIHLVNKNVFVNGTQLQEGYVIHSVPGYESYRDNFPVRSPMPLDVDRRWRLTMPRYLDHGELVVPPGEYFVMGDNRDRSSDSRYWGFVPRGNIMGRPLVIYLSVNDVSPSAPARTGSDGKLFDSGQVLAHFLQLARWDRIFRRVL
jgi:signal peptidase I